MNLGPVIKLAAPLVLAGLFVTLHPPAALSADCDSYLTGLRDIRNAVKQEEYLEEAIKACPGDSRIHLKYAWIKERLRKYPESITAYEKAQSLEVTPKGYFGMGDVYMNLGEVKRAIAAYEKGLAIKEDRRARHSLELALIKSRAEEGEAITKEEFVRVMQERIGQSNAPNDATGPLLRMRILFKSDSAVLDEGSKSQLETVGEALESDELKGQKFEVVGHTDAMGDEQYNLELSKLRAEGVRDFILTNFKVTAENLGVAYFGESLPVAPNDTPYNRLRNRRVEFRLVK
ncbi:MAG: hypothetical protein C0608_00665 [Deltaproteobacteria bacterium]|nr:MAG: hypothetical protein C0608_00665 [Deltaproteobacteria bacterium]